MGDQKWVQALPSRETQASARPRKRRISKDILRKNSGLGMLGLGLGRTFPFQDKEVSAHLCYPKAQGQS